jgi:hypothetical protein
LHLPTDPIPANPSVMPTPTATPETSGKEPPQNQWPIVLVIIAITVGMIVLVVLKKMKCLDRFAFTGSMQLKIPLKPRCQNQP